MNRIDIRIFLCKGYLSLYESLYRLNVKYNSLWIVLVKNYLILADSLYLSAGCKTFVIYLLVNINEFILHCLYRMEFLSTSLFFKLGSILLRSRTEAMKP
jgi:hypothetical protein